MNTLIQSFKKYKLFGYFFCMWIVASCNKETNWLDIKANKTDITLSTLEDLQAVIDNANVMNMAPGLGSLGGDNYYLLSSNYLTIPKTQRNEYIWASDIFEASSNGDWNNAYKVVEYSNIILELLAKIERTSSNQGQYDQLKGSALFFRSKAFADLLSLFAKPYGSSAGTDPGIPIRLSSDVNQISIRATLQESWDRVISDLKTAEDLLPIQAAYQTRPSKTAVQALLARAYLNMEDYVKAGQYANSALTAYSFLTDFNTLPTTTSTTYVFPSFPNNKEIIFWSRAILYSPVAPSSANTNVDSTLYSIYDPNDLRKNRFYKIASNGRKYFTGTYIGSLGNLFSGLATNELYLIRAESYARSGNVAAAMNDLNTLLKKRWASTVLYPVITSADANDALKKIVTERRKELPFTEPIRWDDLRRLNKDPQFAKVLTRNLNGTIYTLPPNDNRYVYPIPPDEIKLSGISQNPR